MPKKNKKRSRNGNSMKEKEVQENYRVIVMWDERYLTEGEKNPQLMTLLKSKYNKHVKTAWRCILGDD